MICTAAQCVACPGVCPRPEVGIFALKGRGKAQGLELTPSTLEYAVTAAASVSRYFLLRNRAVGMVWHGSQRYLLQTDRGERQMRKMLEALAVVSAEGRMSFDQLLVTEGVRLNRNEVILAITADPDPAWVRALREARRRGVHSVAIVMDGSTFGGQDSYQELSHELELSNIPAYHVRRGDDIGAAPCSSHRLRAAEVGQIGFRRIFANGQKISSDSRDFVVMLWSMTNHLATTCWAPSSEIECHLSALVS